MAVAQVKIVEKGGLLLWNSANDGSNPTIYTDSINKLITDVLDKDKQGEKSMQQDDITLKWTSDNNLNILFVAVYFSFQKLLYVDKLLEGVKTEFVKMFHESLKGGISNMVNTEQFDFNKKYKSIIKYYIEQNANTNAKSWNDTTRGKDYNFRNNISNPGFNIRKEEKKNNDDEDAAGNGNPSSSGIDGGEIDDEFSKFSKMKRIRSTGPKSFDQTRNGKGKNNKNKQGGGGKNKKNKKGGKNKGKTMRDWSALGGTKKKITAEDIASLNLSETPMFDDDNNNQEVDEVEQAILHENRSVDLEDSDSEDDSDYVPDFETTSGGTDNGSQSYWSRFTKLVSDRPLERSDVEPALRDFENMLTDKNVANSIARDMCESVASSLIGKQIGTFGSTKKTVKEAMSRVLERTLSADKQINILHGIATAREQKRPYSIVFIGVNGVGKSTTLSKVIYYLKSRGLQVSVAACDTFRSGAVEQLKTHCKALDVRLFDQGYAKDAASVAASAIREAHNKYHDDVVLVDTAGRMQNNEPLMRALVNLISKNNPDLVLFVGEALVGNDGVDQLIEFNRALKNLTNQRNPRLIDGIILTKFDACDDKVGAAISMTYKSGKPIVFLGTGQTYPDLKRAHVKTLVNTLLK